MPIATRLPILFTLLLSPSLMAQEDSTAPAPLADSCPQAERYTFSWSLDDCRFTPRGGTSRGVDVTLDPEPHPGWLALRESGLSKQERDRRAILAMAGPYRASFEFLETVGYSAEFERSRPYHSWATEYIYVIEDSADFISLQHLMVMFMEDDEGKVQGPFVQKHWRQDWRYEDSEILAYAGDNTWKARNLSEEQVAGAWTQAVFQVDDSPRYESWGHWEHKANFSTWQSAETWRPLPRRESSVRDDYDVLEGFNRHTIVPGGWVHEEENLKLRLGDDGDRAQQEPYLAKELGLNRYERIVDFDWAAGDRYWEATSDYWAEVRTVWEDYFSRGQLTLTTPEGQPPIFVRLFQQAEEVAARNEFDAGEVREQVRAVIEDYVVIQR